MKLHKSKIETLFPLYTDWIENAADFNNIKLPTSYSLILIAADFQIISNHLLKEFALHLIDNGACYICLYGNGCFDAVYLFEEAESLVKPEFNFTCIHHMDETIQEAVIFSVLSAAPDEKLWPKCSTILLSIGDYIGQLTLPVMAKDIKYLFENSSNI